jgi:hypothetical protein
MEKKLTAVEWLEEELKTNLKKIILEGDADLIENIFEQAKEMEKQQRISDYYQGACDESDNHGAQYICESNAENWYNEQKQ